MRTRRLLFPDRFECKPNAVDIGIELGALPIVDKRVGRVFRELRNEGLYTTPSQDWTILYPGTAGGINWSGGALDPSSGIYFVPTRNDVHLVRLNKLPGDNFAKTNGKIMSSTFAALK